MIWWRRPGSAVGYLLSNTLERSTETYSMPRPNLWFLSVYSTCKHCCPLLLNYSWRDNCCNWLICGKVTLRHLLIAEKSQSSLCKSCTMPGLLWMQGAMGRESKACWMILHWNSSFVYHILSFPKSSFIWWCHTTLAEILRITENKGVIVQNCVTCFMQNLPDLLFVTVFSVSYY